MKTNIFIFAILAGLFTWNMAAAQVKIGLKAGYNVSTTNFLFNAEANRTAEILPSGLAQIIIPVEITINQHYSFQPEVYFKQTGNAIKLVGEHLINNNFINYWGLGAMNKLRLETKSVTPYALVGLQINYAFNGKAVYIQPFGIDPNPDEYTNELDFEKLGLNHFDLNVRLGLGLSMQVRKAEILLEMTYDKGMIDMDESDSLSAYNEKSIGILMGIMKSFGGG